MSLDELDKQIIAILNADGRENNNEIAKKLSVSEGTIRNRIKKLTSSEVLKVSGQISPDAEPEKQLVFLGIKIAVSRDLIATSEKISKLSEVQSSYITTGRYDLIVEAWVEVKYGLINFLSGPLAQIEGIVSTESFLIMKSSNKWVSP
jgi:Lrp/AsnC family transcriptional regulator for asnA, asnC and gidA